MRKIERQTDRPTEKDRQTDRPTEKRYRAPHTERGTRETRKTKNEGEIEKREPEKREPEKREPEKGEPDKGEPDKREPQKREAEEKVTAKRDTKKKRDKERQRECSSRVAVASCGIYSEDPWDSLKRGLHATYIKAGSPKRE